MAIVCQSKDTLALQQLSETTQDSTELKLWSTIRELLLLLLGLIIVYTQYKQLVIPSFNLIGSLSSGSLYCMSDMVCVSVCLNAVFLFICLVYL